MDFFQTGFPPFLSFSERAQLKSPAKFRFGSSSSMRNFVDVRTIDASRFSHFFVWMESSQFVRRNSQISATSVFISFAQYCTSTCFQSWHSSSKKFKTKHLVNSSARNSRIAAWLRLLKALVSLSKLAAIIGFERLCEHNFWHNLSSQALFSPIFWKIALVCWHICTFI